MIGGAAHLGQALEIFRGLGDLGGEAGALLILGLATDDLALDLSLTGQALQIFETFERFSSGSGSAAGCNNLCAVNGNLGLYRKARELGEMAVSTNRRHQDEINLTYALETLARPLYLLGQHEAAFALLEEDITLPRKLNTPVNEAASLHLLGRIMLAQGNLRQARSYLRSSLRIARRASENTLTCTNLA